jgi:hypothetical protein
MLVVTATQTETYAEDSLGGVSISIFLVRTHRGHTTCLNEVPRHYTSASPSPTCKRLEVASAVAESGVEPDEIKQQRMRGEGRRRRVGLVPSTNHECGKAQTTLFAQIIDRPHVSCSEHRGSLAVGGVSSSSLRRCCYQSEPRQTGRKQSRKRIFEGAIIFSAHITLRARTLY